jgi:hypothetical protein
MATYTPPPYFPQGSLSPPDTKRYRKFKLIVAAVLLGLVALLAALGAGVWYLIKWV